MPRPPSLSNRDHKNLDAFLHHVLEEHASGRIATPSAVGALAHVMAALDKGNLDEARRWFEEGRKFLQQGDPA